MKAVGAQSPDGAQRVAALDALRGLMALAVAVYHLGVATHAFQGGVRSAVVILGVYSVEGFFLISGFCFFHLYARERFDWRELRRFHVKRFFRIAPLYYCAVLLGVVFAVDQAVGPRVTTRRVLENITLSFGLFHPNHAMVIGGWSIGIEYVFYLVFPVLVWLCRSRIVLYALALALMVWAVPYNFGLVQAAVEARQFHAYVQVPNHAFLFLLGAVVADLHKHVRLRLPLVALLLALALIGLAAALTQPSIVLHLEVMTGAARAKYVVLCSLTVLLFAFTRWPTTRVVHPLSWLGELSYSVYLMHPFAWLIIQRWLAPQAAPLAQLAFGLCATLLLAALTQRLVEQPCNAFGRKLAAAAPVPLEGGAHPALAARSPTPAK